jgi:putative ABC transport system permease protein
MFIKNLYFALRHLMGNLLYSMINIVGLAIGLACCLLILMYVRYESSYDRQWQNSERIHRVSREYYPIEGARARVPASTNAPVGPALVEDFPEQVEAAARVYGGGVFLESGDTGFEERAVRFVDPSLFGIFQFDWLAGDTATALNAPTSIVLTESLARKYFGTTDVLGRTLRLQRRIDLSVTGVIKDLPPNTHLDVSGLAPISIVVAGFGPAFLQDWERMTDFHTYLLLRSAGDADGLRNQLSAFLSRHINPQAAQASKLVLMPVADIHLRSNRDEEWLPHGDINSVRTFTIIAFAILAVACINFMSISTARSTRRAREISVRKVVGASRAQLVLQFLAETGLTVLLALLGAIALMETMLPAFGAFAGVPVGVMQLLDTEVLTALAVLLVMVSIMVGSWSAFFLSSFRPASALRGGMSQRGLHVRNALVILQFAVAITLVVATLVIQAQRNFISGFDLGFDKDDIVILRSPDLAGYGQQWPALKAALLASPAIEQVTASHYLPFGFNDNQIPLNLRGSALETRVQYMMVDYDFFETYGIGFLSGRSFSRDFTSNAVAADSNAALGFVLNRSAARALGLTPEQAVNATLNLGSEEFSGMVVGVTNELHFESMRVTERPLIFVLAPPQVPQTFQVLRDASIRIAPGKLSEALAHIDTVWRSFNPNQPVNRRFLREDFDALYLADSRQGQLLSIFAAIAITIACFGLFGLASFNAEHRTKEIGVRKVMGSSVWNIVLLLTNDFSRLVLLSNLIAWPVAYFAMNRWLESFVYRIDLTPLLFIGSGAIALCIAWVTVAGTVAKAASQRPVLALRYE